jgi:Flp pilus assembly protein TadG
MSVTLINRCRKGLERLSGFARARSGAVALQFAVLALPMAVLAFGLIDVNRANMAHRILQDSLDAAALIVAKSDADTDSEAQAIGEPALKSQIKWSREGKLKNVIFKFGGSDGTTVIAEASMSIDTVVADLWLKGDMIIDAHSEVVRTAYDLEVSLILDVTGSMVGSKVADLKVAAADLVNLVVRDVQTPYYSKVAIVPYSMAVNLGGSAATARGAIQPAKTITGASWSTGTSKTVTGATKANPVVITSSAHGFANGDRIYISGASGMTQLNSKVYTVAGTTANTFQLSGVNGSSYSTFSTSSGSKITKCQATNCEVVVTSAGHAFAANQVIYITGVSGMTNLNNLAWTVTNPTANTFTLSGSVGPTFSSYSSSGSAYCTTTGCEYYRFFNTSGTAKIHRISTCVTERTGAQAYTDTAPGTAPLGYNYPSTSNPCLTNTVTPLTATKSTLTTAITALAAGGSTGGHVGVAWGWYTLSPNFSSIFSGSSQPAAYSDRDVMKVAILMTDGEYNTSYCNGVIAKSSTSGSGSTSDQINCDAPNGHAFDQARALCAKMKEAGVVIYTVGFQVVSDQRAQDLVNQCATDAGHVYLPATGTALKDAFRRIGQDLSNLRISK